MVNLRSFCLGIFIFSIAQVGFAATLTLTPKDVAELILKQSFRAEEINLESQTARLKLAEANRSFGFLLKADSGFTSSKFQSSTNTGLLKTDSYSTNLSLSKPFYTGTTVDLTLNRLSDRPSFSAGATTVYADSTKDIVGISVKQNLVKNFFGMSNRAQLRSAEATFESSQIDRVSQLQDLVLEAVRLYWSAYVAQETFQEAINSRDRYVKLVGTIKKKSGYGYTNPGELSQAQAELELKERTVKSQSVTYLTALDNFLTLLKLPKGSDIKFSVPLDIPTPPTLNTVKIEELRPLKAKKLDLEAKEELTTVAKSNTYPDISLVGKVSQQGLDENPNEAYNEMTAGTHPQYYVGISIEHSFGSGYSSENALNAKLQRDLSRSVLERARLELADKENFFIRNIQATYAISLSARNERTLREKVTQELNRSYTQGRTSISVLIDSLNKSFESQIQFTRAVGDYQIALNEWAAFKDELIPDQAPKKP
jgi:outer membrane protein TolC